MNRRVSPVDGSPDQRRVVSLVMRVRVWAELLREQPEDPVAQRVVRSLAAAVVHHADQRDWPELGRPAGAVVRELAHALDAPGLGRLRLLALRLELVVRRHVAHAWHRER